MREPVLKAGWDMVVSRRALFGRGLKALALLPAGALFGAALLPSMAAADAGDAAVLAPIQQLDDALLGIMKMGKQVPFQQRFQALAPTVDRVFNLESVLRISVGSYWAGLPDAQKQKLLQSFRAFTIATYVSNFHKFEGQTITVSPTIRSVGTNKIVSSTIDSDGDSHRIDYVMRQFPAGWQVSDVLLDGTISQVAVQRSDFASGLSQGDASRLIANLNSKVVTLSGGSMAT